MELIKVHIASFYRPVGHFAPGDVIQLVWNGQVLATREIDFKGYLQQVDCHACVDPQTDQEEGDYIYSFRVIDYDTHRLETLEADE